MDTDTCTGKPDVYSQLCPCRSILDRIADKWTALIIGKLAQSPYRFNQLRRAIPGISAKMLTQTLRSLECDGMVLRTMYPTMPVTVEYSLTDLGRSLAEPLAAVRRWAEEHRDEILAANQRFYAAEPPLSPVVANQAQMPVLQRG